MNRKNIFKSYGMVSMSAIFGALGFVYMKNALDVFSVPWFIFGRFGITVIVLLPFLWRKILRAPRQTWKDGTFTGILFLTATMIQSHGIAGTGAGQSSFINSAGIVLIPTIEALLTHKRPSFKVVIGCLLCFLGIGILTWPGAEGISGNIADFEVFLGTLIFAFRTVFLKRVTERNQPNLVSFVEFSIQTLLVSPILLFSPLPVLNGFHGLDGILYTGLVMNIAMIMVVNNALRFISPTSVTVINSTQIVYGAVFAHYLLGEAITSQLIVSGILILSGILFVILQPPRVVR